ncbi:hypothetical protein QGP82_25450 [Leptothoe sp. LEGE 181152]|nr:hypothetical protein [Leptothoe sp. LEGE 181152]
MNINGNASFNIAEDLFEKNQYESAFEIFEKLAENEQNEACIRAEACNMLGIIISGPCPYLSERNHEVDESGVQYFKAAMTLDPKNIGAAHNIIDAFYEGPTGHQDVNLAKQACENLMRWNLTKITPEEKAKISKILELEDF